MVGFDKRENRKAKSFRERKAWEEGHTSVFFGKSTFYTNCICFDNKREKKGKEGKEGKEGEFWGEGEESKKKNIPLPTFFLVLM